MLLIFVVTTSFKTEAMQTSNPAVTLCTAQAFGDLWSQTMQRLNQSVFSNSGLNTQFIKSPPKRATRMFKQKHCDGFFVYSKNFPKRVERDDIIHVPESLLIAKIETYTNANNDCAKGIGCLSELSEQNIVGVFRSKGLVHLSKQLTGAQLVELSTVQQGIEMLRKKRISAFVFPSINEKYHNFVKSGLKHLGTVKEVPLYIWLNKDYQPFITSLTKNIRKLKQTDKWKPLLSPLN